MVVAALAAYKHDTLGRYLPTVLHFRLQATLFRLKFQVSDQTDLLIVKIINSMNLDHR